MYRLTAAIMSIALVVAIAGCDEEPASTDEENGAEEIVEEAQQDDDDQESEESADSQAPRMNETETPDDDEIGQLPDGIGIAVGESAPDVTAVDADGNDVRILDLVDDSSVLVFFYRGGWCPFCNFQVREMTEAFDEFQERGVLPVAISVDQVEEASNTSGAYEIPFPVLSDSDLIAHEGFGVTYQAEPDEVERLAEFGMDLEAASGHDHNKFAVPSVFIIDEHGEVRWAHANLDYRVRPSVKQLLLVVDDLFE